MAIEIIDTLIFLGAVFQGIALNIGDSLNGFPISLFVIGECAAAVWLTRKIFSKSIILKKSDYYIIAFFIYCIFSLFLPILFEGMEVIIPRLGIDEQFETKGRLNLNISNFGQIVYIGLNITTIFYFRKSSVGCKINKARLNKLIIISCIAILFGLWQVAAKKFGTFFPSNILYSTKFGNNLENAMIGSGLYRIQSTFLEASFFGLFMASIFFVFTSYNAKKSLHRLISILCLCMIILSTSFSAIISLLISTPIQKIWIPLSRGIYKNRKINYIIILLLMLSMAAPLILFSNVCNEYLNYLLSKKDSLSQLHRSAADNWGWHLFYKTYGLGVGIGGNATSGLLAYLLSNVGILGTVLFFTFILILFKEKLFFCNCDHIARYNAYKIGFLSVITTMLIAQGTATLNIMWMFIFLISSEAQVASDANKL